MGREQEIRKAVRGAKKPPLKHYVAILIVLALLAGVYFLVVTGAPAVIDTPEKAQSAEGGIQQGVQDISSDLEAISGILGAG